MALVGCRAKPAPDSGFLQNPQLMKSDKELPFHRSYLSERHEDKQYTEIYVAPVNLDYMMQENIWEIASEAHLLPDDVRKNVHRLAGYMRNAFVDAIKKDPNQRFVLVDNPSPHTLILEPAIVQLVPSKSALRVAGFFSWIPTIVTFVAPVVTNSQDSGKGLIAIEARMRDGETGELVGMFADRQRPPFALVDIKSMFWWEPPKPIINGWAQQFIQMQNGLRGKQIKQIPSFEIIVL